jgi:hypothetical protein
MPSAQPVQKLEFTDFSFYPNPATLHINFNAGLNDAATLTFYLTDLTGRIIITEKTAALNRFEKGIDVQQVANGIYFLTLMAESLKGNIIRTTKFIKTN